MSAIEPRYVVKPLIVHGTTYHIVWDTLRNKRYPSAAWITERYAQDDADELNGNSEDLPLDAFWIREVCNADWRARSTTEQLQRWYATRTIEQAIRSWEISEGGDQEL